MLLVRLFLLAAISTAPTSQPSSEVADLRRIIHTLQEQILELKATNARLTKDNADMVQRLASLSTTPATPAIAGSAVAPPETFTDRAKKLTYGPVGFIGDHPYSNPYSQQERAGFIREAQKKDDEIRTFIASHSVRTDIQSALWAGKYKIGMTEDEVQLISAELTFDAESTNGKVASGTLWRSGVSNGDDEIFSLTFDATGSLVRIAHRGGASHDQ